MYDKVLTDPYDLKTNFTVKTYDNREKWFKGRSNKTIGASDAGIILGVNPYQTNKDLFKAKMNPKVEDDKQMNDAMRYGTDAEEPLRRLFELTYPRYHVHYRDHTTLRSKKRKFMTYSPDGLLYDIHTDKYGIYEGKTAQVNSRQAELQWNNRIPDYYFTQLLHAMEVTGFDFAILNVELRRVRTIGNEEVITFERRMYRYERDNYENDIEYLIAEEERFMDYLSKGEEPPLIINI